VNQLNYGSSDYCTAMASYVWQDERGTMPRKKKPKRFGAVEVVKALARERIGAPRPSRVVPDKKKIKKEKHRPTLGEMLGESE
jgi:hypothetical protein